MTNQNGETRKRKKLGILNFIERVGNALPHPACLFGLLALTTLLLSYLGYVLDWTAIHPATNEQVEVNNLISKDGLHRILLEMVESYIGFAPLGIVMVALLGIGVAESSGLISAGIRLLVINAPRNLLTFIIVFTGILSNIASDLGYILIIPIAGVIFNSVGRHPIAGMAAAFAGVSGGFSANLLIGTIDPLLAGLSTEGAHIADPNYYVMPTANYYFIAVSTFLVAILGTFVTNVFVEPRLGKYKGDVTPEPILPLSKIEKKGLLYVGIILLLFLGVCLYGLIPVDGFLRGKDNSILHTPLLRGFIAVLFIVASILGIVYGFYTKKFKSDADVVSGMVDSFKTLAAFLVLVFFASQFVAWFKWSNIGLIVAVNGAVWLENMNMGLIPLVVLFILFSAIINLFMGSASAKWAILAPVFVPMFMFLGYSPELSQVVYRIGDSVTNIISPMMSFFALIIVYFEKYDKKSGIGTLISTMMPYSLIFFIGWTLLIIIWILLELPLGPGAGIYYQP